MALPRTISLISQYFVGAATYRDAYFLSSHDNRLLDEWSSYQARIARYDVAWATYEGNVYRKAHSWSGDLKASHDLYAYVRTIYSPAYRSGEFWASHLYGGSLDCEAGDGVERPTALPIVVQPRDPAADPESGVTEASEEARIAALRSAIGRVWRDSNWQASKERFARFGAVLGDVGLAVVDDEARRKVYLRVVHPRTIRRLDRDPFGNVKGYVLEEWRDDPEADDSFAAVPTVRYTEIAEKEGESVVFRTYRDSGSGPVPYDWRDYPTDRGPRVGPEWTEDYGFVPFVLVQHRDMGLGWGWGELHPSISKLMELDDLASNLDDQVRKSVRAKWLMAGMANPSGGIDGEGDLPDPTPVETSDDPNPGRSRELAYYATDSNARAYPMVAPLDIAATKDLILSILQELERDHPELQADMATSSGDASGRALRVARERVDAMVRQRRAGYDDALVRALKMAVSIGAQKGYAGFEAFDQGSFERGDLDFEVGDRPVFDTDKMDQIAEAQAVAAALKTYTDAGVPVTVAMRLVGLEKDDIAEVEAERDKAQRQQIATAAQVQANALGAWMGNGNGNGSGGKGPGRVAGNGNVPPPTSGGPAGNLPAGLEGSPADNRAAQRARG